MSKFLVSLVAVLSITNAFASEDLVLPGARWLAKASGYKCMAYGDEVLRPMDHNDFNVQFEQLTSDYSLDNGLVTATFEEQGSLCRYSVILFADNDASTISYVDSKAYAVKGDSTCSAGKEMLDQQFADNDYLYWGHPHHVSVVVPSADAEAVCGQGSTHYVVDFTVTARIGN